MSLAFGLLMAMLVLLAAFVAYESYKISSVDLQRQQQAGDLAMYADQLEVDVLNMETGKRGYLLSGDESFLEPYEMGRGQFERDLEEARQTNQRQDAALVDPRTLDELEREYNDILTLFEDQIQTRSEGVTQSEDLQLSQGRAEVEGARETLGQLEDQALSSREDARQRTESALRNEVLLAGGLGLLALLIGLAALLFVRRGVVYPLQRLRDEARATAGHVRQQVSAGTFESTSGTVDGSGWTRSIIEVGAGASAAKGTTEIEEVEGAFGELLGELRLQTERVHSLITSIEDPLLTVDLEGRITYLNAAVTRLTGFDPQEIMGTDGAKLVLEPDPQTASIRRAMAAAEAVSSAEEKLRLRDGGEVTVSSTSSPLLGEDGSVVGELKIMRDLTEIKRAQEEQHKAREAAEDADRAKSEFLANMSHEIRTPMNGVIGMNEILLGTDLSAEQREYAETARSSGEALLTIINDILDFSKIEAGKLEVETIDFGLANAVEESVRALAGRAEEKGLELATRIEPDVPTALRGDPGRIRQVLTNLVGNAVKFTDSGEVVVRVSLVEDEQDNVRLSFSVTDTGIGMTEEQRSRLFTAFSQADASTTRRFGGTGLGLAISKQLVGLMGGELWVQSVPGEGSTFSFELPLGKQPEGARPALHSHAELAGLRALVVDDNATNRRILAQQLSSWGMHHEEAADGPLALEELRAASERGRPYGLALLDMQMPGMDGVELARRIKADPAVSSTHLALLTSMGRLGDAEEARQAGVEAYLTKPVRQSELYDVLATLMGVPETVLAGQSQLVTRHTIAERRSEQETTLLLAEDNAINQKVAVKALEKLGYGVEVAANGREALEALDRDRHAAVLMDVQMPEMDGYEATAGIRRQEGGGARRTPIIAMTANAMAGDREKALAAGMDDYITKPFRAEELETTLHRWLPQGREESHEPATATAEESPVVPAIPEAAEAPLDPEVLASLRQLQQDTGEDILSELIGMFLEDAPSQIEEIRQALREADPQSLEHTAHALKGTSGTMGAIRMSAISSELQDVGRSGDLSDASGKVAHLEGEFVQAKAALEAELEGSGN